MHLKWLILVLVFNLVFYQFIGRCNTKKIIKICIRWNFNFDVSLFVKVSQPWYVEMVQFAFVYVLWDHMFNRPVSSKIDRNTLTNQNQKHCGGKLTGFAGTLKSKPRVKTALYDMRKHRTDMMQL